MRILAVNHVKLFVKRYSTVPIVCSDRDESEINQQQEANFTSVSLHA